jgi:maleylpyruvate isomerase
MKLWGYFRSSAAFRTRIALALKGLSYDNAFVHLRKAEQRSPEFLARNPQGLIPYLEDGDLGLAQSLAICEYLDEAYPEKPLLPADIAGRARVRNLAFAVACDIHPLNNLRVLKYLTATLKLDKAAHDSWYRHWIAVGFDALEKEFAAPATGVFCHGDAPTLADVCLVPQVFNAKRAYSDAELVAAWPRLMTIFAACLELPAFDGARPDKQPDSEP